MNQTISKTDLRNINRQLAEIREALQINDLVNRKQALQILNITSKVLTNYICLGYVIVASRNDAGQAFFSRKQLYGITKNRVHVAINPGVSTPVVLTDQQKAAAYEPEFLMQQEETNYNTYK